MSGNAFGKVSKVKLCAGVHKGQTYLKQREFTAPFKIMEPFCHGDVLDVMILSASAGIMEGDDQEFSIEVEEDAVLEVQSQSYEKIHRMETGEARRTTEITVADRGELFYHQLPVIPFAGSAFRTSTKVNLASEKAKFQMEDIICCGRAALGERFEYRLYQSVTEVFQKGRLIYRDYTCFQPDHFPMEAVGMMEGFTHLGNFILFNYALSEEALQRLRVIIEETPNIQGGVTRLAGGDVVIKALGFSAQELENLFQSCRSFQLN